MVQENNGRAQKKKTILRFSQQEEPETRNTMAETAASREYRENRERELAALRARADSERHWESMESGRKARVNALVRVMGGAKPARVEARKLGKGAKVALRAYAAWARQNRSSLTEEQVSGLSELVREWSGVRLGEDGGFAAPRRDRLRELHQRSRSQSEAWRRYALAAREVEKATDESGRPVSRVDDDEAYVDRRGGYDIDQVRDMLRTARWTGEVETNDDDRQLEALAEEKREERLERRERTRETLDDAGFVVSSPQESTGPVVLDGYSWTDNEATLTLYVELSRPVKAHELEIAIESDSILVDCGSSRVLRRTFAGRVRPGHEDTLWFLEDAGDLLRIAIVKDVAEPWDRVFASSEPQPRSTRSDTQKLEWTQSDYDLTLTTKVPPGTTARDVAVTLRRDSLRVYVRAAGVIVQGDLNRPINVRDSTWALEGRTLSLHLAKLHKKTPWQRLLKGANGISVTAAYAQMALDPPEGGDRAFDDLQPREQLYAETLRDIKRACARGDDQLVQDLAQTLDDTLPLILHGDPNQALRLE